MECTIAHSRLGAALALEIRINEYITTFLGYEYSPGNHLAMRAAA